MGKYGKREDVTTTFGWIDSMSITQVVQAFKVWPKRSSPYGWDVPGFVTSLLICTDNIGLAPGMSTRRIMSIGPIGFITKELIRAGVLSRSDFVNSVSKLAIRQAQQRINRYCDRIKNDYRDFLARSPEDIAEWMDWSIHSAWVEHTQNFGNLIDAQFIPQFARILDVTKKDLLDLQRLTGSLDAVKHFVRKRPDTDAFNMTYECFLLGTLLRGLYHDYLARQGTQQVAHHPFREVFLPKTAAQSLAYDETNVEYYLANIVLRSALLEKKLEFRLARWADNIRRIRTANRLGYEEIDLISEEEPDLAKKKALKAAKTVGIDVHPRWAEELANALPSAVIFAAGFQLDPYSCTAISAGYYLFSRKIDIGKRVARKIYTRSGYLSRLAQSPPGRISRIKIDK